MTWWIRSVTFVLLISWSSYSTILGSWATTTDDLAVANDSRLLFQASSLGSSQGQRVFENQVNNLHQADMWLSTSRTTTSTGIRARRIVRKAVRNETKMWPNAVVPFIISMVMPNNNVVQLNLNQAFEAFHQYTCIRFRPRREDDHDFVAIGVHSLDYSSFVGRVGGSQDLSLNPLCSKSKSTVLKMLGHVIGFNNEVSRPDRDEYVTIRLENMRSDALAVFKKSTFDMMDSKDIPYDYLSIMHYGPYTFSRNGQIVIETKNSSYQSLIGHSTCLSFREAKLANIMYRCSERSRCDSITCPGEGFVGQDCRCWCPSQNRSITAELCPDMFTTRKDDEINLMTNTTNPHSTSWGTLSLPLSVGIVVAIVIGCANQRIFDYVFCDPDGSYICGLPNKTAGTE